MAAYESSLLTQDKPTDIILAVILASMNITKVLLVLQLHNNIKFKLVDVDNKITRWVILIV